MDNIKHIKIRAHRFTFSNIYFFATLKYIVSHLLKLSSSMSFDDTPVNERVSKYIAFHRNDVYCSS